MDARTRLQYKAWRRRKIRRLTLTVVLTLVVAVSTFSALQALGNRNNPIGQVNYDVENDDEPYDWVDIEPDDQADVNEGDDADHGDEDALSTNQDLDIEIEIETETTQSPPPPDPLPEECIGFPERCSQRVADAETMSYLALVNRNWRLGNYFSPNDLRTVNVQSFHGNHLLRASAANALEDLFAAASDAGHTLVATSGYRSYWTQQSTHNHWINVMGETEARRVSARPGHSEHQLGLAIDITTHALGGLSSYFSMTAEGTWVRYNAHRFGFIVRYPYGREADTGYIYEPWHLRFVGINSATTIFNGGLILEEYLGRW